MADIYWRNFDYLIASAPGECPFDIDAADRMHIVVSPRGQWLRMANADAFLIVMDDARGLTVTGHADLFEFTGSRSNFDDWMAVAHPDIVYEWLDQCAVGFAHTGAQLSFNKGLGRRVLRAARIDGAHQSSDRRSEPSPPRQPCAQARHRSHAHRSHP